MVDGMNSATLIIVLIVEYIVIAGVATWERRWPLVLYYVAAAMISVAVLWMRSENVAAK